MFDSTKEDLKDILRKCDEGKLQLPDFQRDYVWNDEDVQSLIASIAKGFPVGALLTLETGSEVRFKPRLLAGVPPKPVEPEELLLDGQQRITSLFQSTYSMLPVRTRIRKEEVERYYYIDIKKAVNGAADLGDAIVAVPADKVIKTNFGKDIVVDLSTREQEYEQDMFPLNLVFDSKNWFYGWRDHCKAKGRDISALDRDFDTQVLEQIQRYKMPIIRLDKKNSREAICLVFEKVNVGGKKLDPFELVTAIYAADQFDLREAWNGNGDKQKPGIKDRLVGAEHPRSVLKPIESTDFLQACTLLHTRDVRKRREAEGAKGNELPQIACNRQALLGLPLTAFKNHADTVETCFIQAAAFVNEQKILRERDVPYAPQLVALATAFALLGKSAHNLPAKDKLARWYWSGALGEVYRGGGESLMPVDVPGLVSWIADNGLPPKAVTDAIFQQERFRTLRGRQSAAYKAIHGLLMRYGCRDFIHGEPAELMTYFARKMDIHHIFPQAWCKKRGIPPKVFNSIVNKTALSKDSNIAIGGDAPSIYLRRIESKTGISSSALDDILRTHLIEPSFLRNDDFEGFFDDRMESLSILVEQAMGKPVVKDASASELEFDDDDGDGSDIED